MKKLVFAIFATSLASGAAMAQSETLIVTTESAGFEVQPGLVDSYTFDLDRTVDASLDLLPADAGDYEIAAPGEVVTPVSYTFDLQ